MDYMEPSRQKLFLIDGNAVAYRAFFAIRDLSTSYGQPTNAVYGFLNILQKLIRETGPDYLACVFDAPGETFRHRLFAEYKVNRPGMPENLVSQLPLIKEALAAYRIPTLEEPGLEADDILRRLAIQAAGAGLEVFLVTGDKDLLQLVNDRIKVYHPQSGEILDRDRVAERFEGLTPEKIPELMALAGDSADNIPGVKGIGEKTALPLVRRFGSVENLYANLDQVASPALRRKLEAGREMAFLSRRLTELKPEPGEAAEPLDLAGLARREPDQPKLAEIFQRLEFKKMLREVSADGETGPDELLFLEAAGAEDKGALDLAAETAYRPRRTTGFEALLGDPAAFRADLADPKIFKAGTDLKAKRHRLTEAGLNLEGPLFDFGLAAALCEEPAPAGSPAEVCRHFGGRLKELGLARLFHEVEMPLLPVLAAMEREGIYLDAGYLQELGRHFRETLASLESEIFRQAGAAFNLNSPQQLAGVLFETLKLPPARKTRTGFSTDNAVLTALLPLHPVISLIINHRQLAKLNSTYVETLPGLVDPRDGRLHTTFNQVGAVTGRLSSERPNLQNIPTESAEGVSIRRAFRRQNPGDRLYAFDYSQVELRLLAHFSGDPGLLAAFQAGRDIHQETAAVIFNKEPGAPVTAAERRTAKVVNFGILYGMSAFGLSQQLSIAPEVAQEFIDAYFKRHTGVRDWIGRTLAGARETGLVTSLLGRRRSVPEINSRRTAQRGLAERTAINTPLQGTAADLVKLAMVRVSRDLAGRGLRSRMILQIHDELLFEGPESEASELADLVRRDMETVLELAVPLQVTAAAGETWADLEPI